MKTPAKKQRRLPVLFLILSTGPTVLLLLTFLVYPTIQAANLSFQELGLLKAVGDYIGLDNYRYLLKDPKFLPVLFNTLKVIFVVPIGTIVISLLIAILLHNTKIREKNLYVTFYFFPYFMSATVIAIVWAFVFYPTSSGVLNGILSFFGLKSLVTPWLGSDKTALWCICAVIIWSCIGYHVVLYMSSLDSISPELYDASSLDGASRWQQTFYITIPLMKNILGITFVLLMSGALGCSFGYSNIMTNGGPGISSTVLMQYVYQQGIKMGNIGYASALTLVTMVISIVLAVLSRYLTRQSERG